MSEALNTRFYTPEEYLELEDKAAHKSEYFQGRIYAMAGGTSDHNTIVGNIFGELRQTLKGQPCRAYNSEQKILIKSKNLYTYPDASVVCGAPQFGPNNRTDMIDNPTVIVEVLSASTATYDLGEKFESYKRLETFQNYVVISQDKICVRNFHKMEDGNWVEQPTIIDRNAMLELASIGVSISVDEIYDEINFDQ